MRIKIVGFTIAITTGVGHTQPQQRPKFDVSVVKPMKQGADYSAVRFGCEDGHFFSTGPPLKNVIRRAYRILWDFSVPDWAGMTGIRYDIEGKTGSLLNGEDCWLAAQVLLEDRFELKLHREVRQVPAYNLVVAKGGAKLRESSPDGPSDGVWLRGVHFLPGRWTSAFIAVQLGNLPEIGRPVVDKTGLMGHYEFRLDYAVRAEDDKPDIFSALQQQLGLKLEPTKASAEFVVIDNIEKPSEN
jgi:uncharacterized protein (TIGR03435 family)